MACKYRSILFKQQQLLAPLKAIKLASIFDKKTVKTTVVVIFLLYITDSYKQKTVHPIWMSFSFFLFLLE
jgi:hypothetical protein